MALVRSVSGRFRRLTPNGPVGRGRPVGRASAGRSGGPGGSGHDPARIATSVEGEVVGVLVATGPLELDLHKDVVEQR